MDKKVLNLILQEGEGQYLEFKEKISGLDKEIVAFANSSGGKIFLGIDDENKIKGIEITNKLKSQIQDIAHNCDPSIIVGLEEFEGVLVVEVKEGENKPYSCSSGFYLRVGANSQKLKRDEIVEFIISEGKVGFDDKFTNVKDYSVDLVKSYLKRIGVSEEIDKNTLINLDVGDSKGNLNNAGILFFTENPRDYLINAYVTCARYKGIEKVDVIDRKDFSGDLISQVENSMEFIKRNTRLAYKIEDLEREEIPEYPVKALREALLNAIMHRDYFSKGGNVQIDIYDNRLTITNIGGLMKPLTIETFGKVAIRRNPLIADLFHRINFIEKMGTGIKRIRESCEEHGGVKFSFEVDGYFISKFKLLSKLNVGKKEETVEKIFGAIKENSQITQKGLEDLTGLTRRGVEWNLKKMKEKGLIERVGGAKGGYWRVNPRLGSMNSGSENEK